MFAFQNIVRVRLLEMRLTLLLSVAIVSVGIVARHQRVVHKQESTLRRAEKHWGLGKSDNITAESAVIARIRLIENIVNQ